MQSNRRPWSTLQLLALVFVLAAANGCDPAPDSPAAQAKPAEEQAPAMTINVPEIPEPTTEQVAASADISDEYLERYVRAYIFVNGVGAQGSEFLEDARKNNSPMAESGVKIWFNNMVVQGLDRYGFTQEEYNYMYRRVENEPGLQARAVKMIHRVMNEFQAQKEGVAPEQ